MHIAHLARAENELLASVLKDELRFILREDMRGAVVLLRQLFLPLCNFAGQTNDHVVFIGLSVNRDGAECRAFDLHGLTPSCLRVGRRAWLDVRHSCFASLARPQTAPPVSAGFGGGAQSRCRPRIQSLFLGIAPFRPTYGAAYHPASGGSGRSRMGRCTTICRGGCTPLRANP